MVDEKFICLGGERNSAVDGKRVRYGCLQFVRIEEFERDAKKDQENKQENKQIQSSQIFDLYDDGRVKAIIYDDKKKNLILGDSNGLLSVYSVNFEDSDSDSDFPSIDLVKKVNVSGRITALTMFNPENISGIGEKRKIEDK